MTLSFVKWSAASTIVFALLLAPASAQGPRVRTSTQTAQDVVAYSAVIEAIEFNGVPREKQHVVLNRIGVRVGDMLSIDVRHRLGRELRSLQQAATFTYRPGSKPGTAKVIISTGC